MSDDNEKEDDNNKYKIRRNVATVSNEQRTRFRDAILAVNDKFYPDGVSYWFKQDQIHQASDVHGSPSFLTWHRELLNRYEAMLKEVDDEVALHYWDWTTDPRHSPDGKGGFVNLFTSDFIGNSEGLAGAPLSGNLDKNGIYEGSRNQTGDPAAPPQSITRNMQTGAPIIPPDLDVINSANHLSIDQQWATFRVNLEDGILHNSLHGWIGGNIASGDTAFEDPFVFMFHSNIDRLWAMWQTAPGYDWRLNADQIYGIEGSDPKITENLEPWAGASSMRPWASPDNQQFAKNSKHPSIIMPPQYDTMATLRSNRNELDTESLSH
ncbi:MAG: tyrosinase family protein [Gammaproteobacteria bacterium]